MERCEGRARQILLSVVVGVAALASCSETRSVRTLDGEKVAVICSETTIGMPDYFRPPSLNPLGADDSIRRHLSSLLKSAGLQPMWCGDAPTSSYRVIYVPAGRPAIVVEFRAAARRPWNRESWVVNVAEFHDPRRNSKVQATEVERHKNGSLSETEIQPFVDALDEAGFGAAPPWKDAGVDGGTMILIEARADTLYRYAFRWSTDAKMFAAAISSMKVAAIAVPPELEDSFYRLSLQEQSGR